ncbi:phosphoadenosine phosphosulfate reductase [Xylaria telfairii]|nr:phosphoadenosine phosphosulfate reductase [Xylaria telfairii]
MTQNPSSRSTPTACQTMQTPDRYPANPEPASSSPCSLYDVSFEIRNKVDVFLAEDHRGTILQDVQARVREAIGVVDEAFQRYEPQEISISYNGGKDCRWKYFARALLRSCSCSCSCAADTKTCPEGLVLLIIILACLAHRIPPPSKNKSSRIPNGSSGPMRFPEKFQAVYIVSPHPFSEIDDFVVSSSAEYQLDVTRYELGMKQGLEAYLADHPDIKAIFVGTRRTDPHGEKLTHFDPTDGGWPDFMRVHPVIDWHYAEIWAFIRHLEIPYCPLYDQGYTSLGGTKDTQPNPNLKKHDKNGVGFLPAYKLIGDDEERLGRDK